MERRKSPIREVTQANKVGPHGASTWACLLECGHTTYRKRRPKSPVRCEKCFEPSGDFDSEVDIQVLQAGLAGALGVAPEDVSLKVDATKGTLALQGAFVWLGPSQVRSLVRPRPRPQR